MNSHQVNVIKALPRCAAGLSLFGSSFIAYRVLAKRKRKGNWTVFDRLLLAMSVTDMVTSFMFLLGDIPIPKGDGGMGNQTTCDIQGFFVQFVPATVMYNGSLALYYLLYITFDWKEQKLQYMEYVIHPFIFVFVISTGTALIHLEMFNPALIDCWIMDKPFVCTVDPTVDCIRGYNAQFYQWLFYYIPIYIMILFSSVAMFLVYRTVKQQDQQAFSWIKGYAEASDSNHRQQRDAFRHSKRVAVQGMFYLGAFYLTWIIPLATRISELANAGFSYPLMATTAFLLPLQGFFNFLVYLRPKALKYCRRNGGFYSATSNWLSSVVNSVRPTTTTTTTAAGNSAVSTDVVVEDDDKTNQQCQEDTIIKNNDVDTGNEESSPNDENNRDSSSIAPPQQEQKDAACLKDENNDLA